MSTGKTSSVITLQISNFTMREAKQQKGGKERGKDERKREKTGCKKENNDSREYSMERIKTK